MTAKKNDILISALANSELDRFLVGESPYFFDAGIASLVDLLKW